ncbi:MAG: sensor histidine kinase [Proteobacteria bacterium]|nr:sensor histidine kinase [Pseudomonadota bacterium]
MAVDIKARAPNIPLTPVIFLRWIALVTQLLVIMGADAFASIQLPSAPLLMLVVASAIVNIYGMVAYKSRLVPEETVRRHLIFDTLQFTAFLYFTGGTDNPFSLLLLAPLAMAASLLSLYNLCLLIILAITCVSFMTFAAHPLLWNGDQPELPPQYIHAKWAALMITVIVISFIIWRIAMEGRKSNRALSKTHEVLEEKRRASALGALAAAAVHELGSPLATIAIIAHDLEKEILPDDPIAEDIALLKSETEKCKKILAEIGQNPAKTALSIERERMDKIVSAIAAEYYMHNPELKIAVSSIVPENLPVIFRSSNLEFGLGNIIGNATSFARSRVDIVIEGSAEVIELTVRDDGQGFAPQTLKAIGQPYISGRADMRNHMGLGIFIALHLLEATGAAVFFANHHEGGALIRIIWPRSALEANANDS